MEKEIKYNNKENPTYKSLMRKTKEELVNIIFRKDEEDRNLRKNFKVIENELKDIRTIYDLQKEEHIKELDKYRNYKQDYEDLCDEHASLTCDYRRNLYKLNTDKYIIVGLAILTFVSIAIAIMF